MSGMTARERRELDIRCWRLWRRGYSWDYVAWQVGVSAAACEAAVRRVECGRYGDVMEVPNEGR